MRISPDLAATNPADAGGTPSVRTPTPSVPQNSPPNSVPNAPSATEAEKPATAQVGATESLALSFRKDTDGSTYYVLTDPQSGQIIREVPPEEIRHLGQSIEEYLKAQAAQATPRTDSKA